MDLNFFQWFRSAIRQTVLLGVSDAMQSLGSPDDSEEMHPQIAALMQNSVAGEKSATRSTSANNRKRLGKSLKELDAEGSTSGSGRRRRTTKAA